MGKTLKFESFYKTTTTEEISGLGDISFSVSQVPLNTQGVIVIDPTSATNREVCFYDNVVGDKIYIKGVNRSNPKTHPLGTAISMNDSAEIFNYLSNISSSVFYVEKIGGLSVKVWGGEILVDNITQTILDTTIILIDNSINYINYNFETNAIASSLIVENVRVAKVITASGVISSITYYNHKLSFSNPSTISIGTTVTGLPGTDVIVTNTGTERDAILNFTIPTGENGDIGNPPDGSSVNFCDNILPPTGATISNPNPSAVKILETNGEYQKYGIGGYASFNAQNGVEAYTEVTGVINDGYIEYADKGFKISLSTGIKTTCHGNATYVNLDNRFYGNNTFNGTTIFKGPVISSYYVMPQDTVEFDGDKATKQAVRFTSSHTMDFVNLKAGVTHILAIDCNIASTITFGTASGIGENGDPILFSLKKLDDTVYPLSMSVGTRIFGIEVFSSGIYITLIGTGTNI